MFNPRPDAMRPAGPHSLGADDADMFSPRPHTTRPTRSTVDKNPPLVVPSARTTSPLTIHDDIDIDNSDMFIRQQREDGSDPSHAGHARDRNKIDLPQSLQSTSEPSHSPVDNQYVTADDMEFTPRQDIPRPAAPSDADTSEAALKLIRWAMQARALLATINALQTKFKLV